MRPSICLNMIVRNEESLIGRCLLSVKPWIDTWVIADTGSLDDTKKIVVQTMSGIPGRLIESDWSNFSENRNEVLREAKNLSDYSIFIDADEFFVPSNSLKRIVPVFDFYMIPVKNINYSCNRWFLLNHQISSKWCGVIHEFIEIDRGVTKGVFSEGFLDGTSQEGARAKDPKKYQKEAEVLKKALDVTPDNSRYQFYLARAYEFSGEKMKALRAYQKRIEAGGELREVFYANLRAGIISRELGLDLSVCLNYFYLSNKIFPDRQEPIYQICLCLIEIKSYEEAYNLLRGRVFVDDYADRYFVDDLTKDVLVPYAYYKLCYVLNKHSEFYFTIKLLLGRKGIPRDLYREIYGNYMFFIESHPEYEK